jgi:menaquinone-dependent protoporphyrinogen oxidase
VRKHREALRRIPVAYFALGLSLLEGTEAAEGKAAAALEPARKQVPPVEVGLFAGALDPRKLSPFLQLLMRLIRAPVGDFRDWEAVRAWTEGLAAKLKEG